MRRLLAVFVCGCVALIAACRAGETFTIADFEKGIDGAHPKRHEFGIVVTGREGSLVDFAITPGRGIDTMYDATNFEARMTEAE